MLTCLIVRKSYRRRKMLQKTFCLIFGILTLYSSLNAQEAKWLSKLNQIAPLQSTENDVEKIFGKSTEHYSNIREYKTKDGILSVTYSTGGCSSELSEYNVAKGIVIDFDFSLKRKVTLKSLNVDLTGFEKEESSDTQNIIYKNAKLGVNYDIYKKSAVGINYDKSPELLNIISIYPAENFSYLECSKQNL